MVKLAPSEEQRQILLRTMERFNEACNYVADVAFQNRVSNNWQLHHLAYYQVREKFGLSAQMTVRAISKVAEAYKLNKSVRPFFKRHRAVVYDPRILSWKGLDRVSILSLKGRLLVPISIGPYQEARLNRKVRESDIILRDGVFYIAVVVDAPEPSPSSLRAGSESIWE